MTTMTPPGRRSLRRDEQLISPLVPTPLAGRPPPLPPPLPTLPALSLPTAIEPDGLLIETARLDPSGRLPARGLFRALGWTAGHQVEIAVTHGLLVIGSKTSGLHTIGSRGQLSLPVAARRICGITPGHPVLLVAARTHDALVVHPAHTIARLLTDWYRATTAERDDA